MCTVLPKHAMIHIPHEAGSTEVPELDNVVIHDDLTPWYMAHGDYCRDECRMTDWRSSKTYSWTDQCQLTSHGQP